jgi:hypothetical protein
VRSLCKFGKRSVTNCALDVYKQRLRQVIRYPSQEVEQQPATPAYVVSWDNQTSPEATSWISRVELTIPHSSAPQHHSPASGQYARVSVDCTGKRVCSWGSGYYFDYDERVGKWELEDELYESFVFRFSMLVLLLGSFVGLTILGLYL